MPIDVTERNFKILMEIYNEACNNVENVINELQEETREECGYDVINNVTRRIKTPQSILKKMKKKNYELNYRNMINYIDDIAGIRLSCPLKSDIKRVIKLLEESPNITILEEKDYIKKPKKSGYSGYHLIVETLVKYQEQYIAVKVEIQIRTMAMDFWATIEHKIRYKPKQKISVWDSKKLSLYAKILNLMDDKIMKLYQKQNQ